MQSVFHYLIAVALLCTVAMAVNAQEPFGGGHMLFDFKGEKGQWISVNDNVMGGVSSGGARQTEEGTLDFSGVLSLENNGGFSSIRAMLEPGVLSGHEGLILRLRGDGRAYYVNLHTGSRVTAGSWRAPLSTRKGEWQEVRLPFSEFVWTAFGRKLPSSDIDPSEVRSLGFTVSDKKEGPFRLEVDWIKAYGVAAREPDLVDRAASIENLSTFVQVVDSAGLQKALRGPSPMTVFAPTNEAFAKLPKDTLTELLRRENKVKLRAVLLNHISPGRLTLGKHQVRTLQGSPVSVIVKGPYRLNETLVITPDVKASNGVLHVIDSVLVPSNAKVDTNNKAAELIDQAISVGVPLYNGGNAEACAAVYEVAVVSLMDARAPGLSEDLKNTLSSAAKQAAGEDDKRKAAWALRRALNLARQAVGDVKPERGVIDVTATGLRNQKGQLCASLFASRKGFPSQSEEAFRTFKSPIEGETVTFRFKDIPFGTYAIALLHDENMNEKMETSFLGIPKEGAGVSNNPKPRRGPPRFEDAKFKLEDKPLDFDIKLQYP